MVTAIAAGDEILRRLWPHIVRFIGGSFGNIALNALGYFIAELVREST
jgi:hypothetical protein